LKAGGSEQRRRSRAASVGGKDPRLIYWYSPRYLDAQELTPYEVTEQDALVYARLERQRFLMASMGRLGEALRSKASLGGLAGIVEMRVQTNGGYEVLDLIVGARFFRPTVVCGTAARPVKGYPLVGSLNKDTKHLKYRAG